MSDCPVGLVGDLYSSVSGGLVIDGGVGEVEGSCCEIFFLVLQNHTVPLVCLTDDQVLVAVELLDPSSYPR